MKTTPTSSLVNLLVALGDARPEDLPPSVRASHTEWLKESPFDRGPNSTPLEVLRALVVWQATRVKEGLTPREDFRSLLILDGGHSLRGGLLKRILLGKEPLPYPPPVAYSRPWYSLIEAGPEGLKERPSVWVSPSLTPEEVVICQSPWRILQVLAKDQDYVVAPKIRNHLARGDNDESPHRPNPWGQFRLTRVADATDRYKSSVWHLRPYVEEGDKNLGG